MQNKLFVGNLPYTVTDSDLEKLFADHGEIVSAVVIVDRATNRSKGFGFVEFKTAEEAEAAVKALNEHEIDGRKIVVNTARPREER